MAPVLPLPNGKASSQAPAGLLYHNFRLGSLPCCAKSVACDSSIKPIIVLLNFICLDLLEYSCQSFTFYTDHRMTAISMNPYDRTAVINLYIPRTGARALVIDQFAIAGQTKPY